MTKLLDFISLQPRMNRALMSGGRDMTYGELKNRVEECVDRLTEAGAGLQSCVGIPWLPDCDTVIAALAVVTLGATYVPLKIGWSPDTCIKDRPRLDFWTEVPGTAPYGQLQFRQLPISDLPVLKGPGSGCISMAAGKQDLFFSENALIGRCRLLIDLLQLDHRDTFFDESLSICDDPGTSVFAPLLAGATLVLHPTHTRQSIVTLLAADPTVIRCTPSLLEKLLRAIRNRIKITSRLRTLLVGGETFGHRLAASTLEQLGEARLIHYYAPRCAGREVAIYDVTTSAQPRSMPVGSHTRSSQLRVVDSQENDAGVGLPGDIWVAGEFFPHPLDSLVGPLETASPWQPTEDRGRTLWNGTLELLNDPTQIRTRRNRVALAHIESGLVEALHGHDFVLMSRGESDSHQQPIAYVCADRSELLNLARRVEAMVPEHFQPSHLLPVSHIPLTEVGDVDRKLLDTLEVIDEDLLSDCKEAVLAQTLAADVTCGLSDYQRHDPGIDLSRLATVATNLLCGADVQHSREYPAEDETARQRNAALPAILEGGALPPLKCSSLIEALNEAASRHPSKGMTYVRPGREDEFQNYRALLNEASCVAGGLRECGVALGEKVILQLENVGDFVVAFWGCVLNGSIPVPCSIARSFTEPNGALHRLHGAWKMLDRPVIVTDFRLKNSLKGLDSLLGMRNVHVHTVETLRASRPIGRPATASLNDDAVILLTSGSTGSPKGVVLTHGNILARSAATAAMNGFSSADRSLNWLPLDHVGGIIMFHVRDVYLGCSQIHATTEDFLGRPIRWLDWIDKFKATITWAPNFAYSLINAAKLEVSRGSWDLSSMRFILNAGEAIVPLTARTFTHLLERHGLNSTAMHPAWGMSETSSAVTFSDRFCVNGKNDSQFMAVGRPVAGTTIRIVDTEYRVIRCGTIGSLQIQGATVCAGYHNNVEANSASFSDGWFNTGDLAFIKDGMLTITGRENDSIIVNGVNYHSHEIEAVLASVPAIAPSCVAACAVRMGESQTDELAIFFSPATSTDPAFEETADAITDIVVKDIGIGPNYIIQVAPDQLPRTAIGKIARSELKKTFEQGLFDSNPNRIVRNPKKNLTSPQWFYERIWVRRGDRRTFESELSHSSVVISSASSLGDALVDRLSSVTNGVSVRKSPDEIREITFESVDKIVYLWHTASPESSSRKALEREISENLYVLQELAKNIGNQPPERTIQLLVVTIDGQPREGGRGSSAASLLRGYLSSIALEHPSLRWCWLDVGNASPGERTDNVLSELNSHQLESEVAYRDNQRFVPRLKRIDVPKCIRPGQSSMLQGFLLLTGGLGGIGRKISAYLLRNFHCSLLLVGRTKLSDLPNEVHDVFEHLQGLGQCEYRDVDVCNADLLESTVSEFESKWQVSLAGIFHLAGEGSLAKYWESDNEHVDDLTSMLQAKVLGTCSLERLLENRPRCRVTVFSSINGLQGGAGFAGYSAANSFLADWAVRLNLQGRAAHCLTWTAWDDIGMSAGIPTFARDLMEASGIYTISAESGITSFAIGMLTGRPHVVIGLNETRSRLKPSVVGSDCRSVEVRAVIAKDNLARPRKPVRVRDQFGTEVLVRVDVGDHRSAAGTESRFSRQALDYALDVPWRSDAEEKVARLWESVLDAEDIRPNDNFFRLGGHSLLAVQVISRVRHIFGVDLPLRVLFESATVEAFAERIQGAQTPSKPEKEVIRPVSRAKDAITSFSQQRLWFLTRLNPNSNFYNVSGAFRLTGHLDMSVLQNSLDALILRHEILRTVFCEKEGLPTQEVLSDGRFSSEYVDFRELTPQAQEQQTRKYLETYGSRPFDLTKGPLLRVLVLQRGDHEHLLLWSVHHIVFDGWSVPIFLREISELYQSRIEFRAPVLSPLPIQYADYSIWHRESIASGSAKSHFSYWVEQLRDLGKLDFPTDYSRPPLQRYRGAHENIRIKSSTVTSLRRLADEEQATLYMVLLTGFVILLSKYSEQSEIVVGTPIAGREREELEPLIGFFVNTLVLRFNLEGRRTWHDALAIVRETCIGAYAHSDVPFELLVDTLNPDRDLSRNPLFQVMFAFGNAMPRSAVNLPGLTIEHMPTGSTASKFDLSISLEEGELITGHCEYSTDLFKHETIGRMLRHYVRILECMTDSPSGLIGDLCLLNDREWDETVNGWNHGPSCRPMGESICSVFEAEVAKHPEAIAVQAQEHYLTYSALNSKANQLAKRLREMGVRADHRVGICMGRSEKMIIALMGILKAGGAYVPIDPEYPSDVIKYMASNAKVQILICDDGSALPVCGAEILPFEEAMARPNRETGQPATFEIDPLNLAYIIFTSGSTGLPKGVAVTHGSVLNLVQAQSIAFHITSASTLLQFASLSFDASVSEIFCSLLSGATLHIGNRDAITSSSGMTRYLEEERITVATLPPRLLASVAHNYALSTLDTLVVAGETCSEDVMNAWRPLCNHFINAYGPTEGTVCATIAPCDEVSGLPPIGRPITNVQVYVLDAGLRPVPIGVRGEIYISGVGLARGYWDQAPMTATSFIPNPFSREAGARMYRTGDLGRWRSEGILEFSGRADDQLKVRGYRIEPGEIEGVVRSCTGVQDAAVIAAPGLSEVTLALYIVRATDGLSISDVREFLKSKLPAYMVPARIQFVSAFPLTANGKIDKAALPYPEPIEVETAIEEPEGDIEETLAAIWSQVLEMNSIGRNHNFFDVGGDSLKIVRAQGLIEEKFHQEISVLDMFQNPTIATLAERIRFGIDLVSLEFAEDVAADIQ